MNVYMSPSTPSLWTMHPTHPSTDPSNHKKYPIIGQTTDISKQIWLIFPVLWPSLLKTDREESKWHLTHFTPWQRSTKSEVKVKRRWQRIKAVDVLTAHKLQYKWRTRQPYVSSTCAGSHQCQTWIRAPAICLKWSCLKLVTPEWADG